MNPDKPGGSQMCVHGTRRDCGFAGDPKRSPPAMRQLFGSQLTYRIAPGPQEVWRDFCP